MGLSQWHAQTLIWRGSYKRRKIVVGTVMGGAYIFLGKEAIPRHCHLLRDAKDRRRQLIGLIFGRFFAITLRVFRMCLGRTALDLACRCLHQAWSLQTHPWLTRACLDESAWSEGFPQKPGPTTPRNNWQSHTLQPSQRRWTPPTNPIAHTREPSPRDSKENGSRRATDCS